MNSLIPELVDHVDFRKGTVYFAQDGEFGSAGAAIIYLSTRQPQSYVKLGGGTYDFWRGLVVDNSTVGRGNLLSAFEFQSYNGPWILSENVQSITAFSNTPWATMTTAAAQLPGLQHRLGFDRSDSAPGRERRFALAPRLHQPTTAVVRHASAPMRNSGVARRTRPRRPTSTRPTTTWTCGRTSRSTSTIRQRRSIPTVRPARDERFQSQA